MQQLLVTREALIQETTPASYKSYVLYLILVMSIVRLIMAQLLPLGNDESYYWLYAQQLQWNYYDHPPMVALWVRLFTFDLHLQHYELFVRLGSVASCAAATWFMYKTMCTLVSERAGFIAAVLYNTSFYSGIIAGIFVMPDSPQMLFWTFGLWMLAKILKEDTNTKAWLLFGISTGLCIMSKVHGAFIWIGVGAYVLFVNRRWLKRWQLYAAFLLTLIIISPILIWNIENDFATYKLHGHRVMVHEGSINPRYWIGEVLGQFSFNNPVNVIVTIMALSAMFRKRQLLKQYAVFIMAGLSIAIVLLIVSISKPVFPHWSGPGYITLIPVAAAYMNSVFAEHKNVKWLKAALIAHVVFIIGWLVVMNFYPGTWGSTLQQQHGWSDVTLDRFGWDRAGETFSKAYKEAIQQGSINEKTPVVVNHWWGAHVEYYFCREDTIPMIGLGKLPAIGHYQWLNDTRMKQVDADTALCIIPSDEYYNPDSSYGSYYENITPIDTITLQRGGAVAKYFYVYMLTGGGKNNIANLK